MSRQQRTWYIIGGAIVAVLVVAFLLTPTYGPPERPSVPPSGDYQRIISLAPSITESLFALGLGDRVVGVTRYCDYPPEAKKLPTVGGYIDPNFEAILALDPDLAVTLKDDDVSPVTWLDEQGMEVLAVDHLSIEGILASLEDISAACGVPARGIELAGQIRRRLDAITARAEELEPRRVLLVIGRDMDADQLGEIYIAGNTGWYNEMIERVGGVNAFRGKLPAPTITAEGILQLNPDVIIEVVGGIDAETEPAHLQRAWRHLPQVNAVRDGRLHLLSEGYIVVPGPRFVRILERLAVAIHPEVYSDLAKPTEATP